MEKLHFPEGCIIEGEIRAVQNEGDVIVEGDFAPLSLVSNHGDVHYKPSSPKVAFEVMRAPNGTLLVEAKDLSGKALEGQSINISADNLDVEGHLRASGELKLSGGSLEITHVGGETIHIRADNLVIEKLTCDGDIHLDAEMAKIVEARARKLVIRGAFNSQKVVAEEAVIAESGKIAIKMLDAPHFEAASDVRGIVMISTCAPVFAISSAAIRAG